MHYYHGVLAAIMAQNHKIIKYTRKMVYVGTPIKM